MEDFAPEDLSSLNKTEAAAQEKLDIVSQIEEIEKVEDLEHLPDEQVDETENLGDTEDLQKQTETLEKVESFKDAKYSKEQNGQSEKLDKVEDFKNLEYLEDANQTEELEVEELEYFDPSIEQKIEISKSDQMEDAEYVKHETKELDGLEDLQPPNHLDEQVVEIQKIDESENVDSFAINQIENLEETKDSEVVENTKLFEETRGHQMEALTEENRSALSEALLGGVLFINPPTQEEIHSEGSSVSGIMLLQPPPTPEYCKRSLDMDECAFTLDTHYEEHEQFLKKISTELEANKNKLDGTKRQLSETESVGETEFFSETMLNMYEKEKQRLVSIEIGQEQAMKKKKKKVNIMKHKKQGGFVIISDSMKGSIDASALKIRKKQDAEEEFKHTECTRFAGVENFASNFVDQLIDNSIGNILENRRLYFRELSSIGEEDRLTLSSLNTYVEVFGTFTRWPRIEEFTKEVGESTIDDYMSTWNYDEDWSYCIDFIMAQSDECSDYYQYDAKWSVPTKPYPIPQATASIYFTIEVSRIKPTYCPVDVTYVFEGSCLIHIPGKIQFQESWLFDIIDSKIQLYKQLKF